MAKSKLKHIKLMEKHCHINDLVKAFSCVENIHSTCNYTLMCVLRTIFNL